jgi:two-component system NtrC family sensor kinase
MGSRGYQVGGNLDHTPRSALVGVVARGSKTARSADPTPIVRGQLAIIRLFAMVGSISLALPARGDFLNRVAMLSIWYWVAAALLAVVMIAAALSYLVALNRRLDRLTASMTGQLAERKRVDEALQASEAFYHTLVENLPLNIIRKDTEGRFTFGNPRFCQEIHLSLDELRGKTDFDMFPHHLAQKYRRDDLSVMNTREPLEATEEYMGVDGKPRYVQIIKTPVSDAAGKVIGMQGLFWEVTDRIRAEEALRTSEARTRLIIDTANDAFVEIDSTGKITSWNASAEHIFGWTHDEVIGQLLRDRIIPPQYRDGHMAGLHRFLETGEGHVLDRRFEITALRRDGSEFPIELTISPIRLGEHYFFAAFIHDITNRTRHQEEIRVTRERFDLAVRGSNDGIWDWDIRTNAVYFSPRWKSMIGYEDEELADQFEEWKSRLHPDDAAATLRTIERYLHRQEPTYEVEHRLRHKDGSYRWILARGQALWDGDGKPYRMAGSHTDITARKEAEQALIQQEKLAGLGQMVAGVAHEINNPLSFVGNNVAVLQRDVGAMSELLTAYMQSDSIIASASPERGVELRALAERFDAAYTLPNLMDMMARSRDGLKRIQQIVKDLRDFARLDTSDMHLINLNEGVESTVNIIRGRARKKQVSLATHLGDIPKVVCYPAKINQVIMNLIANAIDACNEGGHVNITTRAEGDSAVVEVVDDGGGIDAAVRDKIFDPFFTTKPPGEGTGLGLSISYGIIQDHKGTIRVVSEKGKGSTFTIHLPPNRQMKLA